MTNTPNLNQKLSKQDWQQVNEFLKALANELNQSDQFYFGQDTITARLSTQSKDLVIVMFINDKGYLMLRGHALGLEELILRGIRIQQAADLPFLLERLEFVCDNIPALREAINKSWIK